MKNMSSGFLSNCCTVYTGAGEWTTELEVLPRNLKPMLSIGTQGKVEFSSSALNITPVSYWLQTTMTARECRDPRNSMLWMWVHSQTKWFFWVSTTKSKSCCTFLLHPLLTTQDSFTATQNKAVCLWDRITTRVSVVSIKKQSWNLALASVDLDTNLLKIKSSCLKKLLWKRHHCRRRQLIPSVLHLKGLPD